MTSAPTRRRLSADGRRTEIALAARELFADRGFHATTTRDIARAAGISDALLYRHFADKQAVLDRVVDDAIAVFTDLPPLDRLASANTVELLTLLGRGFLGRVEANLDLIRLLVAGAAATPSGPDLRFARFVDGAATALGAELARRGSAPDPAAGYLAARSFFGALLSFVLLQRTLGLDDVRALDGDAYLGALVGRFAE
ncbi:TetR family transcriptional regulator [Frondihabitans australicus]|uniref:TetR family transcriptional regulator n=1 Tax=Frondihabitans australicus TaxID=386892 RepID=A0A495IGW3_9MICO|nr:TetR/AcrR family transcriptional regulator [Frondihabitans australicus]RKR75242.1 TetR family transcriptional regulator [Frondihabitans australicus]